MKKFLLGLLVVAAFTSCSNHGKKITIEGTKGEVFYKGDGVTERDAKKLGEYLKTELYFDNENRKSVQLMRAEDGDGYDVHFVVDETKIKANPKLKDNFRIIGTAISANVFGEKAVNVYLSDKRLKDFETLKFDKEKAAELIAGPTSENTIDPNNLPGWDHDKAGDVSFHWKGISDQESKTIADYIVQNGAFSGGTAHIFMTKEGDRIILSFPMIESARTDPATLAEVEKVSKEIKENVFANADYSFRVTDEQMKTIKTYDY
jgi:hypothetical protein